ncbi:endothelin-converting enzyme homolog [Anneissia japonica]|uniref:endothelin-converting enzyme homolog n=1 Tax=Anneissia japonica TaxID=1529436 RepID=UPI0014257FEE|nr:endothelin-converting enzyme homolog [Anneissia japonica]
MAVSFLHIKNSYVKMTKYKRTDFENEESSNTTGQEAEGPVEMKEEIGFRNLSKTSKLRSKLCTKKALILALIGVSVVLLFCVIGLAVQLQKSKNRYCLTPTCVSVASSVINSMDISVDPCEDFYKYSCGGWIKSHPIPDGSTRWGTFGTVWEENQSVLKRELEKEPEGKVDPNNAREKARRLYKSCMDENKIIESLKGQPLLDVLDSLGGWNLLEDVQNRSFDFNSTLIDIAVKYDLDLIQPFYVVEDEKNSKVHIIEVEIPSLTLPDTEYYLNKTANADVLDAYTEYNVKLAVLLGAPENKSRIAFKEVLELETRIANITDLSPASTYYKTDVKYLQQIMPAIDWISLMSAKFKPVDITIKPSEPVVLYNQEFIVNLSTILLETEPRVLHNYMMWQVADSMAEWLSHEFTDAELELVKVLSGKKSPTQKWRFCVAVVDKLIGMAAGAMFVDAAFKGGDRKAAKVMIEEIRDAFKNNLPDLAWMDDETRRVAAEKAEAVVDLIGFPEFIMNETRLNDYYKILTINSTQYFENNLQVLKESELDMLRSLRQPVLRREWLMTPPTVNAYYIATKNEIVFPAGILQAPFYDVDYPKSLNFGGIGVVMGHELTHAFDDEGRRFDKYGNLRPWWNNRSIERFENQLDCMVDQYSKYKVDNDNVDGQQTIGENIADNGGLKSAFHAYQEWVHDHGKEKELPAIGLSQEQLFFVGFAQVWCTSSTPEDAHLQILTDPHSPAKYRVIGTLSNSEDFAELYDCKKGSRMNPANKCEVW